MLRRRTGPGRRVWRSGEPGSNRRRIAASRATGADESFRSTGVFRHAAEFLGLALVFACFDGLLFGRRYPYNVCDLEATVIRFLNPNYHVILIHYPLALLGVGLLIELFSFLWRTSSVRVAGHWMMLLGALATLPAVTTGIFAKWDILSAGGSNGGNWADTRQAANLTALQWHLLNQHVLFTAIGGGLAGLGAIFWLGSENRFPGHISRMVLAMFLIAMGLMVAGAYNAGEIVYRTQFSTRSQDQADKLLGEWQKDTKAGDPQERFQRRIEFYVDTLQMHVIGAGVVFALVAAAMGLSGKKAAP